MSKKYFFILLALSLVGLADAFYLTREHYLGQAPVCGIYSNSCSIVTQSQYAQIGPIPVALLGVLFYCGILLLTILLYSYKNQLLASALFGLSIVGIITSIALIYIQANLIRSWCYWCLFSDIITLLIFVYNIVIIKSYQKGMKLTN